MTTRTIGTNALTRYTRRDLAQPGYRPTGTLGDDGYVHLEGNDGEEYRIPADAWLKLVEAYALLRASATMVAALREQLAERAR